MENILKNYDYSIIQRKEDEFILCYQEEYFQVGSLVYLILSYGKRCNTLEEILSFINRNDLTVVKLKNIIDSSIIPALNTENVSKKKDEESKKNYWCRYEITSTGKAHKVIKLLEPIFGNLFSYIFGISILLNIILYILVPKISLNGGKYNIIADFISLYVIYFAFLFFHEFGHIAAALKAGLKNRCVNFSMYYVFPVLYVKLDDTWTLNLKERTKINLAGITIQILMNIPILVLMFFCKEYELIQQMLYLLFWLNTVTVAFNLVPFMKFDGYWILSDLLNIPNLMKESNNWLKSLFVKSSPFASKGIEIKGVKKFIFVTYSLLKPLFIILLSIWGIIFLTYITIHSYFIISNLKYIDMNLETFYDLIPDLFLILIAIIAGVRYSKIYFKYKKAKQQKL